MELMPGYKQTELGVIPENWGIYTIGNTLRLFNGRAFKGEEWRENGLPIIRIQNLNDTASTFNYYPGQVEDKHRVEAGDILFAWSGTKGTSFGARIWEGPTGVLNQHIFKVRPDETKLTHRYAFLVLLRVQEEIEKRAHGFKASFVHVKKSDLVRIQLPLPPKSEQEAIAGALSDADALTESLEQLIAKKRDIKLGAMQELLHFKAGWFVKTLGESSEVITKGTTPTSIGRGFVSTGISFLKAESIDEDGQPIRSKTAYIDDYTHKLLKRSQLVEGDILISIAGVLGRVGFVERDILPANTNQALAIIRLAREAQMERQYLFYYLRSPMIEKQIKDINVQAAQANISLQNVRDFQIAVPPSRREQVSIAAVLSDMDAEIKAFESKLAKFRQIKQGMMQNLLTGKIRLI